MEERAQIETVWSQTAPNEQKHPLSARSIRVGQNSKMMMTRGNCAIWKTVLWVVSVEVKPDCSTRKRICNFHNHLFPRTKLKGAARRIALVLWVKPSFGPVALGAVTRTVWNVYHPQITRQHSQSPILKSKQAGTVIISISLVIPIFVSVVGGRILATDLSTLLQVSL